MGADCFVGYMVFLAELGWDVYHFIPGQMCNSLAKLETKSREGLQVFRGLHDPRTRGFALQDDSVPDIRLSERYRGSYLSGV